MISWSIELSEFGIRYEPRGPIKAQCLSDFVAELTPSVDSKDEARWILYVDGSSNTKGSGAGIILEGPGGLTLEQSLKIDFSVTNNQAEYEALIAGLKLAKEVGARQVRCRSDSQLVSEQVSGAYQAKDPQLARYLHKVKRLAECFQEFAIEHIPREENSRADLLSRLANVKKLGQHETIIRETIHQPSVDLDEVMVGDISDRDWMTPIWNYLTEGILPSNQNEARRLKMKSSHYIIMGGDLYRRGFSTPLLKCLTTEQAKYVMSEIHEGVCGMHTGGRSMAARVIRAGYYWPTMRADCTEYSKKCNECQRFGSLRHAPPEELHTMMSPWPFMVWGMDILGPFPMGKGQVKFLLVGIDYFTKWIEAESLAKITAQQVQKFVWRNIICRYGIPHSVVTDNGRQFVDRNLKQFYEQLGIKHRVSSVEHPQTNGQAEAANKVILGELKKRLGRAKGTWAEELPSILWAYRCTPQSSTKETPFRLTFGADAMIPVEVGEPSFRRILPDHHMNQENMEIELDLSEEVRENARIQEEACKQRAARRYNSRLKPRSFVGGDLVWRKQSEARKNIGEGKLAANWEGPYRVTEALGNGAYRLEKLSGEAIPRTWNASHLKNYFS